MHDTLLPSERAIALKDIMMEHGQTLAVCETSAGGMLLTALLSTPGASAYCLGGAVAYSESARAGLLGIGPGAAAGAGVVSEQFALILARAVREKVGATWGLAETGIAGPQTNRRSRKPAGLVCLAVSGPGVELTVSRTLLDGGREANMRGFAGAGIELLLQGLHQYRR